MAAASDIRFQASPIGAQPFIFVAQVSIGAAKHIIHRLNLACTPSRREAIVGADKVESATTEEAQNSLRAATIISILLATIDLNDTLLFTFLPDFLLKRDVSQSVVGICTAMVSVGMIVFTPFMPTIIPRVGGPANAFALGIVSFTTIRLCNAFLPVVANGLPLFIATAIIFLLTGFSYAFTEVSIPACLWCLVGVD